MPGPLPNPQRRRRNAPTIPTTALPAAGREGRPPRVPPGVRLGKAGRAWWRWARKTPQADAWASGHEGVVHRRASLEDDLAALETVHGIDLGEVLGDDHVGRALREVVVRLAGLATGRLQILKEMRELDDRLGLTPKAMAALRWTVGEPETKPDEGAGEDLAEVVTPPRWQRSAAG